MTKLNQNIRPSEVYLLVAGVLLGIGGNIMATYLDKYFAEKFGFLYYFLATAGFLFVLFLMVRLADNTEKEK